MKKVLILLLLAFLTACAGRAPITDFGVFDASEKVKTTEYRCDFDKVVRGDFAAMWDYCSTTSEQDYVSYFIPPDIQSTTGYPAFLTGNTFAFSKSANSPRRYYRVFAGGDSERLGQMDFDPTPPSSFVVERGDKIYVSLSKQDLLARYIIHPGYSVISLSPEESAQTLNDYNISFQITPYRFTIPYDNSALAGLLGLPDYYAYSGQLSAIQKLELSRYKLPIGDSGFINEYLPSYRLMRVELLDGENVLAMFSSDNILSTIIDYNENAALFYAGTVPANGLTIRYVHEAQTPVRRGLSDILAETTGAAYIYSALMPTIITDLQVDKAYDMDEFPVQCADRTALTEAVLASGGKKSDVDIYLSQLKQMDKALCTPTHGSVAVQLYRILQ